jgi:hypothetical protein
MENFKYQNDVEPGELLDAMPQDSVILFEQSHEKRPDLKDCFTTVVKFLQVKTIVFKTTSMCGDSFTDELFNQEIQVVPYDPKDQSEHCEWWFTKGVACKILRPGILWQKGRIRLKMSIEAEFVPDAVESPQDSQSEKTLDTTLEEIRQMMQH